MLQCNVLLRNTESCCGNITINNGTPNPQSSCHALGDEVVCDRCWEIYSSICLFCLFRLFSTCQNQQQPNLNFLHLYLHYSNLKIITWAKCYSEEKKSCFCMLNCISVWRTVGNTFGWGCNSLQMLQRSNNMPAQISGDEGEEGLFILHESIWDIIRHLERSCSVFCHPEEDVRYSISH